MATVGQQLLEAESGWTRYDLALDTPNIKFPTGAFFIRNDNYYGVGAIRINSNEKIEFYFKGTSIRITTALGGSQSEKIEVKIDYNLTDSFSCNSTTSTFKVLVYEKNGLEDGVHKVTITNLSLTRAFVIDTIDLIGELRPGAIMILKNPTTNQHYSLAEKTLISLPDDSDETMINYGIETGKEIKLDEDFDKIQFVQNVSEVLGNGKLFEHEINSKTIKKIVI